MDDKRVVAYPFVKFERVTCDEDGPLDIATWRPGVQYEWVDPENTEAVAHGMGLMILSVVSRHKPGRFPERVFYTRKWVDPEGKEFGKPGCKIATAEKFNRISRGYAVDYRIDPEATVHREF